jgi:hypothetical protein
MQRLMALVTGVHDGILMMESSDSIKRSLGPRTCPTSEKEQIHLQKMATQKPKLKVGIVGAGLGGLAAGVAIARAGADVTILEATKELGEIGAGIQVHPSTCLLWPTALDPDPMLNRWHPMYHASSSAGASTSSSATTSSSTIESAPTPALREYSLPAQIQRRWLEPLASHGPFSVPTFACSDTVPGG